MKFKVLFQLFLVRFVSISSLDHKPRELTDIDSGRWYLCFQSSWVIELKTVTVSGYMAFSLGIDRTPWRNVGL